MTDETKKAERVAEIWALMTPRREKNFHAKVAEIIGESDADHQAEYLRLAINTLAEQELKVGKRTPDRELVRKLVEACGFNEILVPDEPEPDAKTFRSAVYEKLSEHPEVFERVGYILKNIPEDQRQKFYDHISEEYATLLKKPLAEIDPVELQRHQASKFLLAAINMAFAEQDTGTVYDDEVLGNGLIMAHNFHDITKPPPGRML